MKQIPKLSETDSKAVSETDSKSSEDHKIVVKMTDQVMARMTVISQKSGSITYLLMTFSITQRKRYFRYSSFVDSELSEKIISNCKFNKNSRRDGWVSLNAVPSLIKKIEQEVNISKEYFENINVVEYKPGIWHNLHHTAYDLNTERGKKYTEVLGQRLFTITLMLSDHMLLSFPKIKSDYHLQKNEHFYKNITQNILRDLDVSFILNKGTENAYIANIHKRNLNQEIFF